MLREMTLGRLKQVIRETMFYDYTNIDAFIVALLQSEPDSDEREELLSSMVALATDRPWAKGDDRYVFVFDTLCDVYGVNRQDYDDIVNELGDNSRQKGDLDKILAGELNVASSDIVKRLRGMDFSDLAQELIDRSPAKKPDWRSEETTPEDYYAL